MHASSLLLLLIPHLFRPLYTFCCSYYNKAPPYLFILYGHNDYHDHDDQLPVLPHHIALYVLSRAIIFLSSILKSPPLLSIFIYHYSRYCYFTFYLLFSFFSFFSFQSAGANGKGSIGIGINSRVKEVVNQKASNVIEVSNSHSHTITMMMMTIG